MRGWKRNWSHRRKM